MQQEIVNHIKTTFNPDAIILHGSRARGKERPHSDWDFILLYNHASDIQNGRELYKGQNLEYSAYTLPIENIFEQFGVKLQGAQVLYEKDNVGSILLQQAGNYYAEGVHWPQEKIVSHKLWMEGRINGMKDNIENPIVFEKYYTDLYSRIFNYWYWLLQNQHSQPIYIAAEEIATVDPSYHKLVTDFIDPELSPLQKVTTAEKIHSLLFRSEETNNI